MSKKFEKALAAERDQILDILRELKFDQFDSNVVHKQIIPHASYSPWESDLEFMALYEKVKGNTLVDIYRCHELWTLAKDLHSIEGDVLEVGVWRGGTGAILCEATKNHSNTTVYLADTFEGVVKATEEDTVYRGGEHSDTSQETVENLLKETKASNQRILKGIFPDDFPEVKIDKLKLCHIDVDVYLSAKDIFEYAWPKLEVGGVIIFDDYGFWTCEGVTNYFNSLKLKNGKKIHNINGHGIIIKYQ